MSTWYGVELGEALLEDERQQEPGQDLGAGLRDPQLLQQLGPVAIEALGLGLVAAVVGQRIRVERPSRA